mgnify:CR=1 FL=1
MPAASKEKVQLPTVSLREARPFLDAAKAAGCDTRALLEQFALDENSVSSGRNLVAAAVMYDLVDALASASGDPYCGANLGANQPLSQLLSIEDIEPSMSVGDFLLAVCLQKFDSVNSVEFCLKTEGNRSEFRAVRITDGGRKPAHVDAYGAASLVALLRQSGGGQVWDGRQVLVRVCDTRVLPKQYFGVRVSQQTDNLGFSVSFPTAWLLQPVAIPKPDQTRKTNELEAKSIDDPLPALQSILSTHLQEPGLDSERVAQLCGIGSRTLMRRLSEQGTTLKRELDQLRRGRAELALTSTSDPVHHIGASLGYPDPTVFARAFRRWTGMTPTEFRRASTTHEN